MDPPASAPLQGWESWLPLRGRWLRWALAVFGVAAAFCLPALPGQLQLTGVLTLTGVMLLLLARSPRSAPGSAVPFVAVVCCTMALWMGYGLFVGSLGRRTGCGNWSIWLYSEVPGWLMLTTYSARGAASHPLAGAVCRVVTVAVIGLWLLVLWLTGW